MYPHIHTSTTHSHVQQSIARCVSEEGGEWDGGESRKYVHVARNQERKGACFCGLLSNFSCPLCAPLKHGVATLAGREWEI
mmetsp:Transcript_25844/g.64156  ORF Transcript_25844/g.64156 Transcript_25844/m.64156 type:complete len:81 (+) Transcript_25844:368-610(+)